MEHRDPMRRSNPAHAPKASAFGIPQNVDTLGDLVRHRAQGPLGADVRFLFVDDEGADPWLPTEGDDRRVTYDYADVCDRASRAANALAARGVAPGDRVLIVLNTGPAFLAAFLGCQILGAIPVPAVPPYSLARIDEYCARIARLAGNAEATATVTTERLVPVLKVARSRHREASKALSNLIVGRQLLDGPALIADPTRRDASDAAMIQYTSGSTGAQKGVVLTHANIFANTRALGEAAAFRPSDVALAWLPLYHDMGLIGHFLAALVWGMPVVLIPPEIFIKRPREWLVAIERYRGSCSAAPNFAFNLCVKKVRPAEVERLDLSSWRVAFCGAEPVHAETVKRFTSHFAPARFRPETFFPVYGMAEMTLAITFPQPGAPPRFDRVDRRRFERDRVAVVAPADASDDACITWVSVGRAVPRHEFLVIDEEGRPRPERQEGEILVRGPSMMRGYFQNDVATAEAVRADGWLRTGDLGYVADGLLYVTGRRKEIIIKGGRNLYPQDLEATACRVEGVRAGCCAAFGFRNEARGTEDVVLVCETRATDTEERLRIVHDVKRVILDATGSSPDDIVLVPPGTVPKTSSGKIQRGLTRERWIAGELGPGRASARTLVVLKLNEAIERLWASVRWLTSRARVKQI
jgi:acyl-CoA synthetase (AMP-forming)/AMP-acid ligase II